MRHVLRRDLARADILDIYEFIFENDPNAAERWLDAVNATIEEFIARHPFAGVKRDYGRPKLAGMRMKQVIGFAEYLIFYRISPGAVRIVRVLHGARDIPNVLERPD